MPCHPQSALAGLNARPRVAAFGVSTPRTALTARSRAMRAREPGQIRKEAALSGSGHVPRRSLARANRDASARGPLSRAGRTVLPEPGDTARDVQRCKIRAIRGKCTARRMGGWTAGSELAPLGEWARHPPARPGRACRPAASLRRRRPRRCLRWSHHPRRRRVGAAAAGPAGRAVAVPVTVTPIIIALMVIVTRTRAAPRVDDACGMSRLGFGSATTRGAGGCPARARRRRSSRPTARA